MKGIDEIRNSLKTEAKIMTSDNTGERSNCIYRVQGILLALVHLEYIDGSQFEELYSSFSEIRVGGSIRNFMILLNQRLRYKQQVV